MKNKFIYRIFLTIAFAFYISLNSCYSQAITLNIAVQKGDLYKVKELVEGGVYNVNKKDIYGNSPIIIASYNNYFEIVKYLTEYGANLNVKDKYGNTALILASLKGNYEIVRYLIEQGAIIDEPGRFGKTSLMYASAYKGNDSTLELVKYLVTYSYDINIKDKFGKTALDYAAKEEIRDYLISTGAKKGEELW